MTDIEVLTERIALYEKYIKAWPDDGYPSVGDILLAQERMINALEQQLKSYLVSIDVGMTTKIEQQGEGKEVYY
jgi:hypothetical protein